MIELDRSFKGTTVSAKVFSNNHKETWNFVIQAEDGTLWECSSVRRHFPNPMWENGVSKIKFTSDDYLIKLVVTLNANEVPAAIENVEYFENKPFEVWYNDKAISQGYIKLIKYK